MDARFSQTSVSVCGQTLPEGGEFPMKLTDRGMDVLIGVILGATIGLHYPLDGFKLFLVILSLVGVLKLAVK